MVKEKGSRKTPSMVTELLRKAVAEKSQSAVARETGLTLLTVQQYLKGIGEPRQINLERLSAYFGVSVPVLRGDDVWSERGNLDAQKDNLDKIIRSVRANDLKSVIYSLRTMIISDIRLNPHRSEEDATEKITELAGKIIRRIIIKEYRDTTHR